MVPVRLGAICGVYGELACHTFIRRPHGPGTSIASIVGAGDPDGARSAGSAASVLQALTEGPGGAWDARCGETAGEGEEKETGRSGRL